MSIKDGKVGYQERPISAYNQDPIFWLLCSPIRLLYHVIQDFVQKFLRYRQKEFVGVTLYDRGWRLKYCFKSVLTCFRRANFYTNRMMSKVITKQVCKYRNSFYK